MSITGVKVKLVGTDGNAFALLSKVQQAMNKAKIDHDIINTFVKEATSGDYDNLLQTCMKYCEVQ